jgi:KDO2-lipid IV(A) lauroyltransferase
MVSALEKILIKFMGALFRALPLKGAQYIGRKLGSLAYILGYRRRRLAMRNLEMALGDKFGPGDLREIAKSSFEHLGMNLAEFFKFPQLSQGLISQITTFAGQEYLEEALRGGRGVFLLSAHIGNWDLLGIALALRGYPVALITKLSKSEAVNRIWMKYRADRGIKVLWGRGIMKESLNHLREGGIVGFVLDQNARRSEGVFVPFFGKEACTLTSLALLARRTGAPVIPLHIYRSGEEHHVVIEQPLSYKAHPDQDIDIIERTKVYAAWTEKVIRQHPDQWTWLHNRWKTRPRP